MTRHKYKNTINNNQDNMSSLEPRNFTITDAEYCDIANTQGGP